MLSFGGSAFGKHGEALGIFNKALEILQKVTVNAGLGCTFVILFYVMSQECGEDSQQSEGHPSKSSNSFNSYRSLLAQYLAKFCVVTAQSAFDNQYRVLL